MSQPKNTRQWIWNQLLWDGPLTPETAAMALERIATAPELSAIALELRATKAGIRWLIGTTSPHTRDVEGLLTELLPARVIAPKSTRRPATVAARLQRKGIPGALDGDRIASAIRVLYAGFTRLGHGEELVLQLLLGRRLSPSATIDQAPSWGELLLGSRPPARPEAARTAAARSRRQQHGFTAVVRLAASTKKEDRTRARYLVSQSFGALRVLETGSARFALTPEATSRVDRAVRPLSWPLRMPSGDATAFTGWPIGELPLPVLGALHPKPLPPPKRLLAGDRVIGRATAPGHSDPVAIPAADAAFHTLLMGPTGSGKSSVLLNLLATDIRAGRGVLLLDPKGDLASEALTLIPEHRRDDVVVIDPTNPAPIGLNPFAGSGAAPEITADSILATIRSLAHCSTNTGASAPKTS
jgi:hypothetical protein